MSYNVGKDYSLLDKGASSSPSWCIAVYRLGRPISYSRADKKSIGPVIEGALLRKEQPLIISSDCLHMNVTGSKSSSVKNLSATLQGNQNLLSANAILPGDWVMAWIHNNPNDTKLVIKALEEGRSANWFTSGLKFVGRAFSIRRKRTTNANGMKTVTFALQALGFSELSTSFFYDIALATVESKEDVWQFFAQIGLDTFKWLSEGKLKSGQIQDNAEEFFEKFLDVVVGKGVATKIGAAREVVAKDVLGGKSIEGGKLVEGGSSLLPSPQQNKEAPYAYLIPLSVAVALGRTTLDSRKGTDNGHQAFGYADILNTLCGVQRYDTPQDDSPHKGFVPDLESPEVKTSRLRCKERIKGTYIPVEPTFINKPLWGLLNEFKNPTINEMYTCLRPGPDGDILPTIVFRQIPFSTEAAVESPDMLLTRFLSLPRWIIPEALVLDDDMGRSDATRFNFIHVYGQLSPFHQEEEFSIQAQMARNHPIFDSVDVARSGIKPYMSTVACSINDVTRPNGARTWMEAIADWTLGSQNTLNGTLVCYGIQSPISEGDNVQFDSIAFHVEQVSHTCSIDANGNKSFVTSLSLSNGMPIDQGERNSVAPRYPGFKALGPDVANQPGDDTVATTFNPGVSVEK